MITWVRFDDQLPPTNTDILLCYNCNKSFAIGRYVYDDGNQQKWRIDVASSVVWWDVEDFSHWAVINKPA